MAFVLEDRVVETANNPGQGDFELLGAVENNQTFVTGIGNGNTTRYLAIGAEGAEIGVAQVQAGSPDRLLRPGTVKNMDGTTAPVNFTGTVTVACIASVEDVLWRGADGDVPASGGRDLGTSGDPWRNLFLSGDVNVGGALTASDADLGRAPIVSDVNDVVTTRFFTTTTEGTINTPPGVTGTAVGLNICRDTGNDDQAQMYFTTSAGNLSGGVWARVGRDNWSAGAPSDWWRFVMQGPDGVERGVGEWKNFSGAAFAQGGSNLNIAGYQYTRIGNTVTIQGGITAGEGGGSSADAVLVNLPIPSIMTAYYIGAGAGVWRPSASIQLSRRPCGVSLTSSGTLLMFHKAEGGAIVGTDFTTANGDLLFSITYRVGS